MAEAESIPYATEKSWIDTEYLLTNDEGDFINLSHEKSVIIIDYETYEKPFLNWLDKNMNFTRSSSNHLQNNVEKKYYKKRKDTENDDFHIKVGHKTRSFKKDKEKKIRKKHFAEWIKIAFDSEGALVNKNTNMGIMHYVAKNAPKESDNINGGDNDGSNKVPAVEIYLMK